MTLRTSPKFGGSGDGGGAAGGGPATVTFPLRAPPSTAANYAFTSGGGLRGTASGGVALATMQGDALFLDAAGAVTVPQGLSVQGSSSLAGGLTTTTITGSSLTTTGAASVGGSLGVAGSVQADGDLTAQKITARGALGAASVSSTGPVSGASLSIAGKATLGSLEVKGVFQASSIATEGPLLIPTTSASQPGLALADQPSTGVFGAPGTLGFALNGQTVGSFAGTTLTLPVALAGQQASFTQGSFTGALQVQGATELAALQAQSLALSGAASLAGDLAVQGTTRLGTLAIDQIALDHDLAVGGAAAVQQGLTVQGLAQLRGGLVVQGSASLPDFGAGLATLAGLRVPGGTPENPPILRVPVSGQPTTTDYVVSLTGDGALALSRTLRVQGTSRLQGAVQLEAGLSGVTASFSGAGSFGADLTVTGALVGASARLGGLALVAVSGSPEGQLVGQLGDHATDRQTGQLYLKQAGDGTAQGWVRVSTAASSLSYPLQAPASTASAGPSYSFSTSSGDGLGSTAAGAVYLATGHTTALAFDAQQAATFSGAVSLPSLQAGQAAVAGTLQVQGATTLAALQAGGTTVGALAAQATQLAQLAVQGTTQLGGDATLGGALGVAGAAQVAGALASQLSVQAPLVLVGSQRLTSGTADPAGSVAGSPGDLVANRSTGSLWLKRTGTDAQGWVKLATSADGLTFPLVAPDNQTPQPSYGFANQTGLTLVSGKLAAVVGGQPGWTLATDFTFALAGPLQVAGSSALQALTASQAAVAGALQAGSLTVTGATGLAGLSAGASTLASLTVQGGASVAGAGTFGGLLQGQSLRSGPSTWLADTTAPDSATGTAGDLASISGGSAANPLLVRVGSAWRAVALVGDVAATQFPLRGPADSAAAPNFAPAASSPGSGIYSPGANQLGFSTNGTSAGVVNAQQQWSLAGALTAPAGKFAQLQVTGPASITGDTTLGGTLQASGAVTLASSLSAASLAASGTVSAATASISGALSAQSASISGDATVGGTLTVNGTTTFAGVQKIGYVQVGDGTVSAPAVSFQAEPGLGFYRPSAGALAFVAGGAPTLTLAGGLVTTAGALRVGGTNAGLTSPGANQLALQTAGTTALSIAASGITTFAFQAQHAGGSTSAPGVAVGGATTGLWAGTDASSNAVAGIVVAGSSVAFWRAYTFNSLPVYQMNLGLPTGTSTGAGIIASAQTPNGGSFAGFGGQLYQWQGGGAGASLWVNEATSGTSNTWAKVLTSTSPLAPTFPLQSTTLGTATSPAYGFAQTGYTSTGFLAANDVGANNLPAAAVAAGGTIVVYLDAQAENSKPIYNLCFGNPAVSAAPYNACIRASAQAAAGGITGAVGQLAINNTGGAGTVLAVKESGNGTQTGWSLVYTQGTTQLAGQAGSVAAPYHSFSNSLSSGFSYSSGSGIITSVAGSQVFNIGTVGAAFTNSYVLFPAGSTSQPSVAFTNNTTSGFYSGTSFTNPAVYLSLGAAYWGGFVRYGSGTGTTGWGIEIGPTGNFANGGVVVSPNLPTNTATASPGTLFISQQGSVWLKESGSQTQTGYAQLLTTSTQLAAGKFAYQSAAPATVASVGQVYALSSDGNLYYVNGAGAVSNLSKPTFTPVASNTAPAATYTTTAADSGRQFVNNSTTQSVVTLYTVPSGSEYQVTFIVGNSGGFSITAPNSQVIYIGTSPTTASNITSAAPGSVITLSNPGGLGTWFSTSVTGAWNYN